MLDTSRGLSGVSIVVIIAVLLVLGGVVYSIQSDTQEMGENMEVMEEPMEEGKMMEDGSMMKNDEAMMEEDDHMMEEEGKMMEEGAMESGDVSFSGSVISGSNSPLLEFNEADYQKALASDKLVVLYFYANWCPLCKEEFGGETEPAFDDLTTDKVVGFRVHYNDNETTDRDKELAREFGIGYQHTKVFLKDGERVLKSPETCDKERYIEEINKNI